MRAHIASTRASPRYAWIAGATRILSASDSSASVLVSSAGTKIVSHLKQVARGAQQAAGRGVDDAGDERWLG